jgi:adhesin/invasin
MRQRLRAVGLFALAIVAITCTDAPTSPSKIKPGASGVANIRMSPTFSPDAARIYSGLAAFGLEVTEVHVVLTGPDGSKKDTVIAFPASQDQITIEIPVPSNGTDQAFDALVELRNDQHVVLFSGHQTVIARAANLPQQTPPLVIISYTGPGKGAKTVTVSPSDTTIAGTATIGIRATAVDSAGLPVTNLLVQFAVSDATLAVATSTGDATGTLTGLGRRGTATLRAITPLGIAGSSRITFVPPAARIVVISGNGQTGAAGSTLAQPLVVEVQATDNLPVPGASVAFRAVTAGGSVQQTTVIADANGRAATTLTLGTVAGAYAYEAGSGTLPPVSVSATATAAPAAAIAIVSGDAQTDTIAKVLPLPFVVKVTDQFGGPVSGATVSWTRTAGNGILGATSTSTNVNGTTSITYTLGATASNDTVRASVAGVTGTVLFSAKAVSRVPATIAILSGGNQSGLPNTALTTPIVARVSDAQNAPIAGATVAWSATGAGATFNPASGTTDAQGQVSTLATLGATPGTTTVTATVGTSTATTTLTTTTPAQPTLTIVAGDQQSAVAGTTLPIAPSVLLKDGSGNAVPNAPVVFAVVSGGGSITGGTTATNTSGVATLGSWTLGTAAGPNTLTATSGSLSVTFTATGTTPAGPNHLVFGQGPPSPFVIGAPPVTISVHLFDGQNNAVPQSGVVVTMTGTASPGPNFPVLTATTDNTGAATFIVPTYNGAPGTVTLDFSATGITGVQTQAIPIVAGAGTKLLLVTQPAATAVNQAPFTTQPVVQLADAAGNPVSTSGVQITATFASGPTTPTPVLIQAGATTNASGQATFSGMAINGAFGVYTLSFSAPGYTSVVSNAITNGAGPANTLQLLGGNGQNALVNTAVGVPPIAKVIDAQGNGVPGVDVTFTAVNSGSTVSNGTTTGTTVTVTTNSFGNAQLTAWTMSSTAGPHTVTASATVPNGSPVTFTANGLAAGGSKFILLSPLPTQITVGAPGPTIDIQIVDANNNPVQQVVSVNIIGNVQPSGVNFNFTLSTNAQGIINLTLSPFVGLIGNEIFTISASGFTTLITSPVPIVAGSPAALRMASQPSASAQNGVPIAAQPTVRVVDVGGNTVSTPTPGIAVTATVTGATLSGTTTVNSNAGGIAAFTNLALTGATGSYNIDFSAPSLNPVTTGAISLTAGPASSMSIQAGDNQTAAAGGMVPILPAVKVTDAGGAPVAGVGVLFTAVTSGSFVDDVHSTTITTNAQGIAQVSFFWMLSPTAGPNTLTASASGLAGSPLTFHATGTPGTAVGLKLLQAVPASITVGLPFPAPVQVQLVDQNDNPVSQNGVVVTATANVQPSNTTFALNATTASNGIATFNLVPYVGTIGTLTFTLTAPSVSPLVTPGITVLAGSPSKVVIVTQPPATAASGAPFVPQPALQVTDVGSNAVNASANIAATIQTGSGTLGGTSTIATNASGAVTFGNLSLSGAPGSFTLRFAATGLTAVVSNTINLGAGGPAAIVINAGNGQVVAAGTTVPIAPSVRVNDGAGNALSGITVTFASVFGGGTVTGGTAVTNGSGIATVGTWTLGTIAGTNNVTATVGALTANFQATGVAGPAAKLALSTPPSPTASSGAPLAQQPQVQRQDQFGNPVQGSGVVITASVLTGSGTLTNATATTNAAGLATFSGLTISGSAGALTLDFNSAGVTHIASGNITLGGGAAAAIANSAGDNQTAAVGTNVAIAPSVLVTDAAGNPVAGVAVTFAPTLGGGSTPPGSVLTNASGIATVGSWQLGIGAGTNNLTATAGALSTTFTATAVPGPATQLIFVNPPPPTATSGVPLSVQPAVQRKDQYGNNVSGAFAVTASVLTGTGTLTNATVTTNAGGLGIFTSLTITGTAGTLTLDFNSPGVTHVASSGIALSGGAATTITKNAGDGQTAIVASNVAVDPAVLVTDGAGNPVVGAQVTFTVASGGGVVTGTPATTNASGIAQVSAWQLGNIAGPNTLTATLGALTTTFGATGVAAPPAALSFTTQPPTTATSGAALSPQPIIQVRDQFGNATGATGIVTAVPTSGSGTLTNATATINSSGLASFSGLAINGSGTFTLQFASGSLTAVSSQPITITTGPAANIVFGVQPSGGTGGAAITPAFTVRLVDANGNTVVNNTNTVDLNIAAGTGTQGATLSGGIQATFVNGVATFSTASIDFGGTGYALRATANLLNAQGAPMTSTSNTFTIQPGTGPFLATKAGNRVSVAQVGATSLPTATHPIFVARNAQGQPAPGLTVDVTAFGRCRLLNGQLLPFTTLTYTSDVNGEVTPNVQLPTFAGGSGCLIKATGATFTTAKDSSQIAVFPAQTSHVWTGAANSNWQNAANWIPVTSAPSVPSSTSDNVFIPNYSPLAPFVVIPVVSGAKPAMNRLTIDSLATIDLGNIGIDIGPGGVFGWGFASNGSIHIGTSAPVNGIFDVLDAGQTGVCGTFAPMLVSLRVVVANVLNVRCKTNIDTTSVVATTLNVLPNNGQGWLHMTSARAALVVNGNANFTGDSLWVNGGAVSAGTATFGGGVTWSGGTFVSSGNAVFASDHAFYQTMQMFLQGNATFGGPAAGQQNFDGGQLTILGNFAQVQGIVGGPGGQTFSTSNDHVTVFAGTSPQTVSFETAGLTSSNFSVLRLQNQSSGGVQLVTNAQIVNGTALPTPPRVDILLGKLQINTGATFDLNNGSLHLSAGTNLNLLGNITGVGQCAGKTTNGATITGPGTFNGTAPASFTCDDDR